NPIRQEEPLPHPAVLSEGRLMVPLFFLCRKLGITAEFRPPAVVNLELPERAAAEGGDTAGSVGVIVGRVLFGGRSLSGAVLRLVRDSDLTFVPDIKARTDTNGRYRFTDLPPGRYRVYAYVGDNPDYFNRETSPLRVTHTEVVAPTISMGRIIRPVRPRREARVPLAEWLQFEWTSCPGAASYELTITDPESHEEVVFKTVRTPKAVIPGAALVLGRRYQCRVLALTESGDFLGATPGMGVPPWSIMIVAYADFDSSDNAGKED
ncbi:MAG: carboxypeptidase-like regulatory domain-containing protein, partial [Armatimonadota bacterium]|nr:carboxypeptidase-like regulatory domain-containing protein [Armatimonadota bacterium]